MRLRVRLAAHGTTKRLAISDNTFLEIFFAALRADNFFHKKKIKIQLSRGILWAAFLHTLASLPEFVHQR